MEGKETSTGIDLETSAGEGTKEVAIDCESDAR